MTSFLTNRPDALSRKAMADIPVATVDDLASADGSIFGTPTRFGNMCGQESTILSFHHTLFHQGMVEDNG